MLANAILCRWNGGWIERTDSASIASNGRIELFINLGAIDHESEAYSMLDAQLTLWKTAQEEITPGVAPIATDGSDDAYIGYQIGDTITVPTSTGSPVSKRVTSITIVEENETGKGGADVAGGPVDTFGNLNQ
jgi:hypothetical protein